MTKEMEFFIFLIEKYAHFKERSAAEVMKELKELDLIEEIFNRYEFYHIERIENAYDDIDILIKKRKAV